MRALLTLALASAALTAHADEITLTDGRRVMGTMSLEEAGHLHFVAADKSVIAPESVRSIRFAGAMPRPFRAGVVHQAHLIGEQRLTGELLTLDDKTLALRTGWSDRIAVPRGALVGVTNLPGTSIICDEDFEKDVKAWKLAGAARLTDRRHTSGKSSLLLDSPGQSAAYALPTAVETGTIGVNFFLPDTSAGARWLMETEFQAMNGPQLVRTTLADETGEYAVDAPTPADEKGRLKRQPGWHRFAVEFSTAMLLVTIDDEVLWYSREKGPGGPLREVRLMCVAGKGAIQGEVAFDEFTISRAVELLRRSVETSAQDEVWQTSGDQLFGRVTRLDRRGVEWEGRFGKRSFSWADVRGVFPQRLVLSPMTTEGAQVRVWLRPARGTEPDVLEGVMRAFDERRLTLRHAALGDLVIDRPRLVRLWPLFHGKRIELENGARRLGKEEPAVDYRLRLERQPQTPRLVMLLRPIKGRAEVVIDGRVVADLPEGSSRETAHQRVSIPLPRDSLKVGEHVVSVRIREEAGRRGNCVVSEVAVELPE